MKTFLFKNFFSVKNFVVFLPVIYEPKNEQKLETWNSLVGQSVSIDLILTLGTSQPELHKTCTLSLSLQKYSFIYSAYKQLWKTHEWHSRLYQNTGALYFQIIHIYNPTIITSLRKSTSYFKLESSESKLVLLLLTETSFLNNRLIFKNVLVELIVNEK